MVLRSPTPIKRPPPVEQITPEVFAIESLQIILAQVKDLSCEIYETNLTYNFN